MLHKFLLFSLCTLQALLSGGCATTSMQGSWSDPDYRGGPIGSVFVVGTAQDDLIRRVFEDAFAQALAGRGVEASRSYRHLKADRVEDRAAMQAQVRELGADAVLVSRIVGRRTETVVNPGRTRVRSLPDGYRDHWYEDYRRSYEVIHTPATVSSYDVVTVQSSLYGSGGELLWKAQTETVAAGDLNAVIDNLIETLVEDLVEKGLL